MGYPISHVEQRPYSASSGSRRWCAHLTQNYAEWSEHHRETGSFMPRSRIRTAVLACIATVGVGVAGLWVLKSCYITNEHPSMTQARAQIAHALRTAIIDVSEVLRNSPPEDAYERSRSLLERLSGLTRVGGVMRTSLLAAEESGTSFELVSSFNYPATQRGIGPDTDVTVGICVLFEVGTPPKMAVRQVACPLSIPHAGTMVPGYQARLAELALEELPDSVAVMLD